MPRVSVLMPVYNMKEEYLRESIESILNQTFTDFEFIILDDCSAEDIQPIIKSYKDDRIKFYKNIENLGIAQTRNKLMDIANGEYLALMDADDISLPLRLEKQVEFLDKNPDVSIVSSAYETFPQKQVVVHPESVRYMDLLNGCVIANPAAMVRKKDFEKYNLRYKREFVCCQDYEIWARAIKFLKIANLEEVLLKYRLNESSVTRTNPQMLSNNTRDVKKQMLEFLTSDKELQTKILNLVDNNCERKNSFFENIFSIRNIQNFKVITIFGIKIMRRKV